MQKTSVENSKEQPYSVYVRSGDKVVAELKLTRPGTLNLQGGQISWRQAAGGTKIINCTEGGKLEFSVDGKSVLTVSGDAMTVQNSK